MKTETLQLVISGDGNQLGTELGRSERQVRTFSGRVGGMLQGTGKRIMGAVGKLSPLAMIGGAAGVAMAARQLIDYQDTLSSLGITARLSAEDMMLLDQKIHGIAYSTGQSREKIVSALRNMVSDVDTEYAVEAIENVAMASTAMSFDIEDTAKAFIAFRRDMGATNDEAMGLFNTMMTMNQSLPVDRLANASSSLGVTKDNLAQYNALIHTVKNHVGGEDRAARMLEQVVTGLRTSRSARRYLGNQLFDADNNIKDYKVFLERVAAMNDSERKRVFKGNHRLFSPFGVGEDGLEKFDAFIAGAKEAGFVTDAFSRKQAEAKFQLNALGTAAKEFASIALSPMLAELTKWMSELTGNPEAMERFRRDIMNVAGALGEIGRGISWVAGGYRGLRENIGGAAATRENRREIQSIPRRQRNELLRKHGLDSFTLAKEEGRGGISGAESARRTRALLDDYYGVAGGESGNARMRNLIPPTANAQTQAALPEINNHITLNATITESGRLITSSSDINTRLTGYIERRGAFQ